MTVVFLRCSDGHLFTAARWKRVFLTFHLNGACWLRCPVDHKWRVAEPVSRFAVDALPEAEVEEATGRRY
jgi:hypothetical protein